MAGDWIPWCKGLAKKPEVLAIARTTGLSRREVAATLMEFWEWADSETDNGSIPGLEVAQLSHAVAGTTTDFWSAVSQVGWLTVLPSGLVIPRFDRWMGKSAKKRLENTIRQRLSRLRRDTGATTVQNSTDNPPCPPSGVRAADSPGEEPRPGRARRSRPDRDDPVYQALVRTTGLDPLVASAQLGRACKALRSADPPYTPDEIQKAPAILAAKGIRPPYWASQIADAATWARRVPSAAEVQKVADAGRQARMREDVEREKRETARAVPVNLTRKGADHA